jgi:hypothetical protein
MILQVIARIIRERHAMALRALCQEGQPQNQNVFT